MNRTYPHPVEVATHTILYVRHIYPAELFTRRKKYDTPVFQSRHPALNEYIAGAVKAIADELAAVSRMAWQSPHGTDPVPQGNLDKVVIVIKGKDDVALERYVFAVQNMIQVEAYNKDTRSVR